MKKTWLATLGLSLCVGFAAIGCGDDDDDDNDKQVKIDVPGVEVNAEELQGAAGAAAPEAQ